MALVKILCGATVVCLLSALSCGGGRPTPEGSARSGQLAAIDPLTAATISGKVTFEGQKPELVQIQMSAEASCVALHKQPVYSDQLVVNANGAIQYVFIYVKEGMGGRVYETPKEPVVLEQNGCMFRPHVLGMQTGQILRIVNQDPTTHNIHPTPRNNREWNKSMLAGIGPIDQTFAIEEVMIPVKCNVHPWMRSYIGVLKHPFFAVTSKEGTYEIKGLPPGSYTLEAWHEKLGTSSQSIRVGERETKAVDFVLKMTS